MKKVDSDDLVVERALEEALDVFGPLAKEAVFAALTEKFSSSINKCSVAQIEDSLVEIMGTTAGKIFKKRFREALEYGKT